MIDAGTVALVTSELLRETVADALGADDKLTVTGPDPPTVRDSDVGDTLDTVGLVGVVPSVVSCIDGAIEVELFVSCPFVVRIKSIVSPAVTATPEDVNVATAVVVKFLVSRVDPFCLTVTVTPVFPVVE